MSLRLLQSKQLLVLLERVDADVAEQARVQPCRWCGSRLHRGNYWRKPRGVAGGSEAVEWLRHSFCCSREGCRKRLTPASVRFLGRRVYLGVVVVLVTAVCHGLTPERVRKLREQLGNVDRRTLDRWRVWWTDTFVATPFWKQFRGKLSSAVDEGRLPASLLGCFGRRTEGLVNLMKALAPLTTGSDRSLEVGGFRWT